MNTQFQYDVFLSHSSKDKDVVREIAERLKADDINVWFDEWEIQPGDNIPRKIEQGLEHSRVLVLCMSENAFGSDWAQLESYTFRFRDPKNKELRFIPLKIDEAEAPGSLAQFSYIDWRMVKQKPEYTRLLEACRFQRIATTPSSTSKNAEINSEVFSLGIADWILSVAFSNDATRALSACHDNTVRLWDLRSGRMLLEFGGHDDEVYCIALSEDGSRALTAFQDHIMYLWDLESGRTLRVLEGHSDEILSVELSGDATRALSASRDETIRLWDLESGQTLRVLEGHTGEINSVALSVDGTLALSGSDDRTVRLWDVESGQTLSVLEGHSGYVYTVAFSKCGRRALSGSEDKTLRLWDLKSSRMLCVLYGHTASVWNAVFSADGRSALSGSNDQTVRLWDLESGRTLHVLKGHNDTVESVAFSSDGTLALSGSRDRTVRLWDVESGRTLRILGGQWWNANSVVLNDDGTRALSGSVDDTLWLWDLESGRMMRVLEGHQGRVVSVALSGDRTRALSASYDETIRFWDLESGRTLQVLKDHNDTVEGVALSHDGTRALSGSRDRTVRLWDVERGRTLRVLEGHTGCVTNVALSSDGSRALSGSNDQTVRVWDVQSGRPLHVLEGHTGTVNSVAFSGDGSRALSGSDDQTVRVWDVESGRMLRVLEGHTDYVSSVAFSGDGTRALSGSNDATVRVWDVESGRTLHVLKGHTLGVHYVAFSDDATRAFSAARNGVLRIWNLTNVLQNPSDAPDQIQYTNAKVLLVGNSAVGKTGLSNRLALDIYKETDSTVGAWATQWKLPLDQKDGVEREIWLWDFGGQADQRLIHQLYMDQTQVATLVFDPQRQELLQGLAVWDRDMTRAATGDFQKLLVAGRIDVGGLRNVSRHQVEEFAREHGFANYIETSAKENIGCEELKETICELIDWDSIARRTTPTLFRQLKEEIVALKDEGRALMRFNELREALTLRMSGARFSDEELKAVITLLAGPGVVWELGFGSWTLLASELINAYAQAVIRTIQEDDRELGCITEESVLAGKLTYPKDLERLPEEEERILLLAMHRLLVENNLCLSEPTDTGTLLVFPSYARRERPDLIEHPSVMVSYQFEGFLDDIYATLVVRLHRISPFTTKNLWNGAADFETMTGQKLGVKLVRHAAGKAELLVYFDPELPVGERMLFSKYIQEHLFRKAKDREQVKRLRHWFCDKCGEPVANRERAMQRLHDQGAEAQIICVNCEEYVHLWDEMEAAFADPEILRRVRELEAEADRELDNESKERTLVGEVISTVSLAGQISREFPVSDHGIDMEIEFKNDDGEATGQRLYLQLKSGDSHLTTRKRDDAEIFKIPKQRHVKYWMEQAYPVMLVIRSSEGEVRWMEIRDHLREVTNNGEKQVRQIEFEGERFDVMSVRRWREKALTSTE